MARARGFKWDNVQKKQFVVDSNGVETTLLDETGSGGGSETASIATSTTSPSNPADGDLWFDTTDGTMYVYYNDGTSSQWIGISGATGATGATGNVVHSPGDVIQVQYGEYYSVVSYSFSSTIYDPQTTAQATITPKFANSKILISCNGTGGGPGTNYEMSWHLKRDSTWIGGNTVGKSNDSHTHASGVSSTEAGVTLSFNYLDSPNTTNATTYILGFQGGESTVYHVNKGNSTGTLNFNNTGGCTITLMEIAG